MLNVLSGTTDANKESLFLRVHSGKFSKKTGTTLFSLSVVVLPVVKCYYIKTHKTAYSS